MFFNYLVHSLSHSTSMPIVTASLNYSRTSNLFGQQRYSQPIRHAQQQQTVLLPPVSILDEVQHGGAAIFTNSLRNIMKRPTFYDGN